MTNPSEDGMREQDASISKAPERSENGGKAK